MSQTSGIIVKTMMVITKTSNIGVTVTALLGVANFSEGSILMSPPPNLMTDATVFLQRDKTGQKGINSKKQSIH